MSCAGVFLFGWALGGEPGEEFGDDEGGTVVGEVDAVGLAQLFGAVMHFAEVAEVTVGVADNAGGAEPDGVWSRSNGFVVDAVDGVDTGVESFVLHRWEAEPDDGGAVGLEHIEVGLYAGGIDALPAG